MNRRELAARVAEVLEDSGVRKDMPPQKATFHITDDFGGKSDFTVKRKSGTLKYNIEDIVKILEVLFDVVTEAMRRGEKITIAGFGIMYLKRRAARSAPHPITGETIQMKEHYVIKFDAGKSLKRAASLFTSEAMERAEKMAEEADNILSDSYYDEDEDVIDDGRT